MERTSVDCIIIGGGPAGLSAALMLGRALREVIVFDHQQPRNAITRASYGFITHDGSDPREIRRLALRDISKYSNVRIKQETVMAIENHRNRLEVTTAQGEKWLARKIILATGLKETLPAIEGIEHYYGRSLFSCPYCDGWELREQPMIFISDSEYVFHMSRVIAHWSSNLAVCTNGNDLLTTEQKQALAAKGIAVYNKRIIRLHGKDGQMKAAELEDGTLFSCVGGFITPQWEQASTLAESLGCKLNAVGAIETDAMGRTSVEHIYAAGDNAIIEPALISIAVAEGSRAAIGVNTELIMTDFHT